MHTFIICLIVFLSILLIGLVLIQKSKGGGLSSQFGNASASMGVRQTNTFLERGTWWLVGLIVALSIVSAYTIPTATGSQIRTQQEQPAIPGTNQYDQSIPAIPELPAAPAETPATPGE